MSVDATQLVTELGATHLGEELGEARADVSSVSLGEQLGDYQLERRLGAGGMGEVFAARRCSDGEHVALKVLGRTRATNLYRFKREFRALADVAHRNLVRLHELVVPIQGPAFFTMELIDGLVLSDYVRGRTPAGQLPSLERLLRVFRQLIAGIHALHTLGCVHRDLKPSNVLVDRSGRVVILDFGLVSESADEVEGVTHDGQLLGTPAYMAPEQAIAGQAGPAADYYALGIMLYECLSGARPFSGSAMQVMIAKQDGELPDPGARVSGIPRELREACMQLLHPDPQLRPTSRELLAQLGQAKGSTTGTTTTNGQPRRGAFIGRAAELAQLRAALRDVHETQTPVTVCLHGPGGSGKSALLSQFSAKLRQRQGQLLVLSGRCLERESVPYKGFDAIVDALSVHLRRLPAVEAATLQPRHATAMTTLFPVLADVWQRLNASPAERDPTQQRKLGLNALRELIMRLCDRQSVVVCIDDFQWADLDSVRLLAALLRPPLAPALLLLLSFRDEPGQHPALLELRDPATFAGHDLREMALGPLRHADAVALALALLPAPPDPAKAEALARRAHGNPFWLIQLALGAEFGSVEIELDELLVERLGALEVHARQFLTLVALAGGPLTLSVAKELLGAAAPLDELAEDLSQRALLVHARIGPASLGLGLSTETGAGQAFELAHPRMRATLLDPLEPAERTALQLQLARALEHLGADAETLARHFAEAGDQTRAADYCERSAREAADSLAFSRAVEAYRETLELLGPGADTERVRTIRSELAQQLIYLGHSGAAGDLLLELAAQSEPEQRAQLRRQAVTQLAHCGRIDESIEITHALLSELGEPMPRSQGGAIVRFLVERIRLWFRGEHFEPRDPAKVDPLLLSRVDTLMASSLGLALHEVALTQALGGRGLRLAFDSGDPQRLAMGLAYRYLSVAALGRFEYASELGVQAREIAALTDDPEIDRANDLSDAMVEWFRRDTGKSLELFTQLLARADREPIPDWIRSFATVRYAELCRLTGNFADFSRNYPRWIAVARERGNRHEAASLEAVAASVATHYGEAKQAQVHIDAAREHWQASRYTFTDATIDIACCDLLICQGQPDEARARFERFVERFGQSGIANFRTVNELVESLRMRVMIAQLLAAPANTLLYRKARKIVAHTRRRKQPRRMVEALLSQAALHSLRGDDTSARGRWRRALRHCERHDMRAHLAAIRLRLAGHTKGREAAEFESVGLAYLDEQGIGDRETFVRLLAPARH